MRLHLKYLIDVYEFDRKSSFHFITYFHPFKIHMKETFIHVS